jgi:hypothetical protein
MSLHPITPGATSVYGRFTRDLGPRLSSAGLGVQFHYNQPPGIHFKVDVPPDLRDAILQGLADALAARFPDFPATASIWVTEVDQHPVNSSWDAFYKAARMVIDQAYSLSQHENGRRCG